MFPLNRMAAAAAGSCDVIRTKPVSTLLRWVETEKGHKGFKRCLDIIDVPVERLRELYAPFSERAKELIRQFKAKGSAAVAAAEGLSVAERRRLVEGGVEHPDERLIRFQRMMSRSAKAIAHLMPAEGLTRPQLKTGLELCADILYRIPENAALASAFNVQVYGKGAEVIPAEHAANVSIPMGRRLLTIDELEARRGVVPRRMAAEEELSNSARRRRALNIITRGVTRVTGKRRANRERRAKESAERREGALAAIRRGLGSKLARKLATRRTRTTALAPQAELAGPVERGALRVTTRGGPGVLPTRGLPEAGRGVPEAVGKRLAERGAAGEIPAANGLPVLGQSFGSAPARRGNRGARGGPNAREIQAAAAGLAAPFGGPVARGEAPRSRSRSRARGYVADPQDITSTLNRGRGEGRREGPRMAPRAAGEIGSTYRPAGALGNAGPVPGRRGRSRSRSGLAALDVVPGAPGVAAALGGPVAPPPQLRGRSRTRRLGYRAPIPGRGSSAPNRGRGNGRRSGSRVRSRGSAPPIPEIYRPVGALGAVGSVGRRGRSLGPVRGLAPLGVEAGAAGVATALGGPAPRGRARSRAASRVRREEYVAANAPLRGALPAPGNARGRREGSRMRGRVAAGIPAVNPTLVRMANGNGNTRRRRGQSPRGPGNTRRNVQSGVPNLPKPAARGRKGPSMWKLVKAGALGAAAILGGRTYRNAGNSRALVPYRGLNNGATAPYRGYYTGVNYRPGVGTLRVGRMANGANGAAGTVPPYVLQGSIPRGWANQYGAVEGARQGAWNRGQAERGLVLTGPPGGYGVSYTADPGLYTWGGPGVSTNAGEAAVTNNAPPPAARSRAASPTAAPAAPAEEANQYGSRWRWRRAGQLRGSKKQVEEKYKLPKNGK